MQKSCKLVKQKKWPSSEKKSIKKWQTSEKKLQTTEKKKKWPSSEKKKKYKKVTN